MPFGHHHRDCAQHRACSTVPVPNKARSYCPVPNLPPQLGEFGKKQTGLEQYAIVKYAEAFEVVPRTLAENSGLNATNVVHAMYSAHAAGAVAAGLDVDGGAPRDLSGAPDSILDLFSTKWWVGCARGRGCSHDLVVGSRADWCNR